MPRYSTCDYRYNLSEEDPCLAAKARFNRTPFCGNTWYKFLCIVCSVLLLVMLLFVVIGVLASSWSTSKPGMASSNLNDSSSTEPLTVPMELTGPPADTTTEGTPPSTSTEGAPPPVLPVDVKVVPIYPPKRSSTSTTSTTTESTTTTTTTEATTTTTAATTTPKVVPVEKAPKDINVKVDSVFQPRHIHRDGITMIIPAPVTPSTYIHTIQGVAHGARKTNVNVDPAYQSRTTISGESMRIIPASVTAAPVPSTVQSITRGSSNGAGVERYKELCRNPELRKSMHMRFCDKYLAKP